MNREDISNTMTNNDGCFCPTEEEQIPGLLLSQRRQKRSKTRSIHCQLKECEQKISLYENDNTELNRDCSFDLHAEDELRDSLHLTKDRLVSIHKLMFQDDHNELKNSEPVKENSNSFPVNRGNDAAISFSQIASLESLQLTSSHERTLRAKAA